MSKSGRRDFLYGLGAAAAVAPFWSVLGTRAQTNIPKRLLIVFTPNGTIQKEWFPDGGETDFRFRRILKPLEPFRDRLLIFKGLDMVSGKSGPGDDHQKGIGHLLTGTELLAGDVKGGCEPCAPVSWSGGISLDQHVANHISSDRKFRSLELGVQPDNIEHVWTRMSYRGASQPLPPRRDPYLVYQDVFGDLKLDPAEREKRRALGQSVLDFAREDFAALRSQLGSEDRARLDAHTESLADIERRLGAVSVGAQCDPQGQGNRIDIGRVANYPAVGRLQMDILVQAFACDLTRVGSLMWTNSVGDRPAPWLDISEGHHSLSHTANTSADSKEKLIRVNHWYAEQFAYLLGQLDAIREGSGTMLDNTLVLWGNELGDGDDHKLTDVPFLLAGNVDGYFRTGRYFQYSNRPHNDLLATIANAMGAPGNTFGKKEFNTGLMNELRA